MLGCLIWLVIYAIVALIVVLVFEQVMAALGSPLTVQIVKLLRLLVGLLALLYFLFCLLGSGVEFPRTRLP
jgi:hypothetical protein